MTKTEARINDIVTNWVMKHLKFYDEQLKVEDFIYKQLYSKYISKIVKKIGALNVLIPIDIDGRQYVINPIRDNCIFIRDDKNEYYQYLLDHFFEKGKLAVLYKNYTRQYKDIELIFDALDDYLDKQTTPEWNTVERIDEVIKFMKKYIKKNNISAKTDKKVLYVKTDFLNTHKQSLWDMYFKVGFDNFVVYANICKEILSSSKEVDLYSYSSSTPNGISLLIFDDFLSFVKDFEVNKYLIPKINNESFISKITDIENKVRAKVKPELFSIEINKKINELIKNIIKQTDIHLYEKLHKKWCKESKENQNKPSAPPQYNYSDWNHELSNLFYNPFYFNFLLPNELSVFDKKVLVQVHLDLDSRYIPIKIRPYVSFSFFVDKREYLTKIDLYNFINESDVQKIVVKHYPRNEKEERYYLKFVDLIKNNKFLILKYILNEIENRFGEGKQTNNDLSLSDLAMVECMDQYLSNLQ